MADTLIARDILDGNLISAKEKIDETLTTLTSYLIAEYKKEYAKSLFNEAFDASFKGKTDSEKAKDDEEVPDGSGDEDGTIPADDIGDNEDEGEGDDDKKDFEKKDDKKDDKKDINITIKEQAFLDTLRDVITEEKGLSEDLTNELQNFINEGNISDSFVDLMNETIETTLSKLK